MPNLRLKKKRRVSPFRKVAIGTWENAYDPSVYGVLTLKMDEALRYRDAFRAATGRRLTINHMVAKAVGMVLKQHPEANAVLRWNRLYERDEIGVFFQVVMQDPKSGELDLSGCKIREPQDKSLTEIIDDFEKKVDDVRDGSDKNFKGSRDVFSAAPYMSLNPLMKLTSFLSYTLNLDMRWAGVPRDPFGSVMVTNVGSLGLPTAFVPLVPYSRVPLLLALGAVEERAIVEEGEIVTGMVMDIGATFDHRILDGGHAAKMQRVLKKWMQNPFDHFDPVDDPSGRSDRHHSLQDPT